MADGGGFRPECEWIEPRRGIKDKVNTELLNIHRYLSVSRAACYGTLRSVLTYAGPLFTKCSTRSGLRNSHDRLIESIYARACACRDFWSTLQVIFAKISPCQGYRPIHSSRFFSSSHQMLSL